MTSLHIAPALAHRWAHLAASVRGHVSSFAGEGIGTGRVIAPRGMVATFADDLARGAPALRVAFPDLARRVIAIDDDMRDVIIRVASHGTHDGQFFGFLIPTGRTVSFAALHRLRVDQDALVEDRVELDLGEIIRQLSPRKHGSP